MKTAKLTGCLFAVLAAVSARGGETALADRLQQLEERQSALERRYELDRSSAAAKGEGVGGVGKDGLSLRSADGATGLKFSGDFQADGRFYLNDGRDSAGSLSDTFLLRRVRPTVEFTHQKWITGRVQANFGGGAAGVDDANVNLAFRPWAQVRIGRFKPPVGLENLRPSARLTFVERSLPTGLVPNYDLGASLWGELGNGRLLCQASVTNGAVDGANVDAADAGDRKDFAARVFAQPFKASPRAALAGLGVGFAGSTGRHVGSTSSPGLTSGYRTIGQNAFFTYQGRALAAGNRTRWSPQLTWHAGRWGLLAEHVSSRQMVRSTVTLATADLLHRSWQIAASCVLTGEDASEKGVRPRRPFEPGKPGPGAWEAAARVSRFTAAEGTFDAVGPNTSFASAASSAREARAFSGGLNWHVNAHAKIQASYEYTSFDGGAAAGDRPVERAVLTRLQWAY